MVDENVVEVLNNQLPVYFRPIIEFQEIMKAYGYTLEELKKVFMHIWDNFYLISCDGQTLSWYEVLLGITKTKGLTLEERRVVVLMQYSMRFLYTLPVLKEMLASAAGMDNYTVECLYEKYQMIVKIIGQDISLVKETYNMVARIKPAHIELLLYAEYRETAEVAIRQAMSITFISTFYPRFNIPTLFLNSVWELDGSQALSGYDGIGRIDLYPVQMEIKTSIEGTPEVESEVSFLMEVQEEVESTQAMEVRVSAECRETTKESLTVQVSVAVNTEVGDVMVDNLNYLDNEWGLDGSRELNGGVYLL